MVKHAPVIIRDRTLQLGRNSKNVDSFEPVKVFEVPLAEGTSYALDDVPFTPSYFLPPIFAEICGMKGKLIDALYTGKRCVTIPDRRMSLDLQSFGWSNEPIIQEGVLSVKGAGLKVKRSRNLEVADLEQLTKNHGLANAEVTEDDLVFSHNRYIRPEDDPEGTIFKSHLFGLSYTSRFLLNAHGIPKIKVAPEILHVCYPGDVRKLALELQKDKFPNMDELGQEQRIMPSFLRVSYFEQRSHRNPELLSLLGLSNTQLRDLNSVMLDDIVKYFLVGVDSARNHEFLGREWVQVGNIDHLKSVKEINKKDYGWYHAKDVVVAPTGLYFVDMGSVNVHRRVSNPLAFHKRQHMQLTSLFKDFTRFLAFYNVAVEREFSNSGIREIEEASQKALIDRINQTGKIQATKLRGDLEICIEYPHLNSHVYVVRGKDIPAIKLQD